ncbi:MAG TPA: amino acid adenylation domain-containing protein, partial [Thermoanaerobaculia bacterium]|nr:amino acid adenylation domain-containing protein [Thermoanaerobaculia bacterium]
MTIDTLDPFKSSPEPAGPEDGVFVFPTSYAQQRLWFLDQLAPGSPVYNLPFAWRLRGPLETEALASAVAEIVERHESLRTTFAVEDREPVQVVSPPGAAADLLSLVDLSFLSAEQREAEARQRLAGEALKPFDLEQGPLFRAGLLRFDDSEHVFFVTLHHIVSDGWSFGVFQRELAALYNLIVAGRPALLPELSIQYADFSLWQRDFLRGENLESQLAWWKAALEGAPPVLELPFRPRPAVSGQRAQRGAWRTVAIPRRLGDALREVGQSEGATRFMTLLAAFEVLLHLCTGQEDLVVGTPVSGRTQVETEGLIGLFVNTLALRTDLSGVSTFRELLARVKESALGAYSHQELPFERLVEELQPERSLGHNPLVQVTFSIQERARDHGLELEGLCVQPWGSGDRGEGTAKFDLSLFVEETPEWFKVRLDWDAELLDEVEALRLLESYQVLLEGIAEDPWRPLWSLPVLPQAARHQLIAEWNDTVARQDLSAPLHERFASQAARTPAASALIHQEMRLTYAELDRRANCLARRLRALGAGLESRVGVALERTPDLIVALLAVQKTGGAYVPLDPAYPRERLAMILEDSQAGVLITSESLLDRLPPFEGETVLMDREILDGEVEAPLPSLAGPRNLAYLIYTSGSTGRPKGVAIEHRSAAALLEWAAEIFPSEETVLASTSITFDLSVFEIFLPLTRGGTVVLAENALALPELPSRESVTLINTVPSAIAALVRAEGLPASVRTVNLAGEPLKRALVNELYAVPTVEAVYNLYGPSEDTTYSTWERVPRNEEREPTIGAPIANTQAYVLDRWLRPLPVGVPGELFLAGAGLARGYLNRPDLTAAAFVPDPFGGERLYRTGDLARRLPDGRLEFLGRMDHQVKVRGYRIELGEIESHLLAHPGVREAVVLALGEGGERSLAAFVVGDGELRSWLETRLPAHMIPSSFVHLDALPLSPNGKVDRKALAGLAPDRQVDGELLPAAPRTATEELLAGIWADVLRLGWVGAQDNFFNLGGHSLLATQVVSRVREVFRTQLPLRALFEAPTLAKLAARLESSRRAPLPSVVPVPRDRDLPASFAQERLWFLEQLGGEGTSYNLPSPLRLRGPLMVPALAAALGTLADRHESLRTTFTVAPDGTVLQRIAPAAALPLALLDLGVSQDPEAEALRLAAEDARRPFDLRHGPLLRATLLRLGPEQHVLLLAMHHIVSDGWSMRVLIRELTALYAAFAEGRPSPLPGLPVQYADFAVWQRGWLAGAALEAEIDWWREQLAGAPAVLELPADRPRPAVRTPRGVVAGTFLSADLAAGLQAMGRRANATLFMTLLGAFQVLLRRYSGQDYLPVGTPIANRNRTETEGLIGLFVNTLVLRGDLSGAPAFPEVLRRTRETALAAYDHQDLPFEKLVEALQPERSLAHTPLFQVMFLFQAESPDPAPDLGGLFLDPISLARDTAKLDLTLAISPVANGLAVQAEVSLDLFDVPTAHRLLEHFRSLVEEIAAGFESPISELLFLAPAERHVLIFEENDTAAMPAPVACLHELFEAQADLTPEAEALVAGEERLSYAELDRRANRLARRLRRLGVGPEVRVGITLERTADLLVSLLAVLKTGGAYVPLDPAYPRERLDLILEDAEAAIVVDHEILYGLDLENDGRLPRAACPGNAAYVIYTSGSTGRPKGVAIEHRSADALIRWAGEIFGPEELSGVLASTSITFDLSVFELFLPLARGGKVILAGNALALPDLPSRDEVRLINTVPSAIAELLRLGALPESVRTVNLAGEPLKRALVDRIYALPHVEAVYNLYGPSEDTTYSTWVRVPRGTGREPSIGVPVGGTRAYVLDTALRPLPIGVPGELCLAGEGLARGYLNRPDLTAAAFVPDPCGSSERMYRTGDLARRLPDGELEFLGRMDHQVKVRGFRIELGEIETALLAQPEVRAAVVLALGEGGERRLVAYVVGEAGPADLRTRLESRLPAYMVPSVFAVLDVLPLTPNGKVDRKALAQLAPGRESTEEMAAVVRTAAEELLAGIWADVLRIDRVGLNDNFFNLGGHSLLATQVVSRARDVFRVDLPLRALFETPTVATLAARLESARRVPAPPIPKAPGDHEPQASFAQERLWFLDRFGSDRASYNLPAAIHLRGRLNVAALAAALSEIVRRHESLRTTFRLTGGAEPRVLQVIGPAMLLPLPVVDLTGIRNRREEAARLSGDEARRIFDLSRGPLLRTMLVRTGGDEHTLLLTQHHIVSDGWSIGVLLRELRALYSASRLPELPIQYADFAVWQRGWLQGDALARQLGWWRDHLAGAPAVLELPADRPRPAVQSARGGRFSMDLPAALQEGVQLLARRQGATSFMVLLAAFQALLGRLAGRDDVVVGSPIAGRNRAEVEELIGYFVNTLVLRANLAGDPSFRRLLGRSRETILSAYDHQDLPFEKLVEELQPERSLAHTPLFQVMFILQNARLEALELPGLSVVAEAPDTGTTKFDLRLSLLETDGGLAGSIVYNRDLFDESTLRRLASHYGHLLAAAVADPELPLSHLPLLGEAEAQHVLREWNDSRADWDLERPLHSWIEEQARRVPDALALAFEGHSLTYRELDDRAGRLAARLRRLGVGPESRVGIAAERSLELVVGLLGILKAGGAYVPLDPSYPQERLAFMVEDFQTGVDKPVLLTQDLLGVEMEASAPFAAIAARDVLPEHPAYVIYTSGSTGRPKGAVNTHRAIVNRLVWMQAQYGLTTEDVVLQKTPYSFDVSVWEFFWPLMYGARLVVAKPGGHQDSAYLADLIRREGVTTLHFVPSMLQVFLEQPGVENCTSLRRVICSGEALPYELQQRFFARLGSFAGLHNLYGPTEA